MLTARLVDRVEMELVNRGEGFFHVGGAGHEASAVLNHFLTPNDWLHLHYRDKALMIARGIPPEQFFHSLICTADSHSAGRQMSAHLSAPELKVLSLVGPVGNNALQAVGVAHELKAQQKPGAPLPESPLVICAVGDGTSQQGEFLEAVAEAVRAQLPVLFWIEDNGLAISTTTAGRTFYELPSGPAQEFYGLPIHRLDGRDALECERELAPIVRGMRQGRGPAVVVFRVERLTHHTNADDERVYRGEGELKRVRGESDPVVLLEERLREAGVSSAELEALRTSLEREVRAAADRALAAANPQANTDARPPLSPELAATPEYRGRDEGPRYTMLEALREGLRSRLKADGRVTVFGQDLEDPKGDVFGMTRGLSTAFPGRVQNSALAESTIVGVGIGRALAGGRPVACIQFADFVPIAFNQIASELGSMWWRTAGGWQAPVIIMAPCGGYRPGLGPFHAQTFESILAHVPGIDVVMPSTAGDAAGLLNAAFRSRRPTVFLYPKVCLNDPTLATSRDVAEHCVLPGKARFLTRGDSLTLVTWGGTVPLCQRVVNALQSAGVTLDLIDLRSLSPWDVEAVCASVVRTRRLLVVHEDNLTCGFGAEVLATVAERVNVPVKARRVTRPDTYVPCNYVNQLSVLPSFRRILTAVGEMCGLDVAWPEELPADADVFVLEAAGSSPADQSVAVVEWKVKEGARIEAGDLIADCEADKATFELRAPVSGVIRELRVTDEKVPVGTPLAKITTNKATLALPKRLPVESKPVITPRPISAVQPRSSSVERPAVGTDVGRAVIAISAISSAPASRVVTNDELVRRWAGRSGHDIFQRTGIESRHLLGPGETVLTLAVRAARAALRTTGLTVADLDAIFVSTSSPLSISPSLACLLHYELSKNGPSRDIPASDILAACTGYLYALQVAFDFCRSQPAANILVVTAEAMSTFTNPDDFDTAIVFADAATATLVHGPESPKFGSGRALLHRPVLSARGEDGTILHHGRRGDPNVNMDGLKVFPMAVRQLIALLKHACAESQLAVEGLDYIIPHQANGRILEAVDQRLKLQKGRLVNRVKHSGNTSSSTIPIVLAELLSETPAPRGTAGLCAFGGGFTFGAAVLEFV
ncbi:MAG TPA: transketolase [Verrucomicrobiales bacterium]|nr:transketolase [Verrucomicrobiales bacterium]